MRLSLIVEACVAAVCVSCSSGTTTDARPLAEHRPSALVAAAARHLGEDCATGGYRSCISRLCGHFAPAPESGYFCSRACTRSVDCPRDWNCAQAFPAPGGSVCVPPAGWRAGVAVPRDGGLE